MKHLHTKALHAQKKPIGRIPLVLFLSLCLLIPLGNLAQPADFVDEQFAGPFNTAVGMTFDANGRMYVWERRGVIWTVDNGVKSSQPLLDISEEVGNWRDFGLLGVALDPNFLSNGHIYLLYIVDRHHLLNFGTSNYNPNTDEYFDATIGRITRYTAQANTNFTSVDYSTRKILLGESITTGFPNLHQSHGTGHLVFGTDGTLLASFGDGASYSSTDEGSASETYWQQAIADGIIPASHNIGAYRSQILSSLAGKIVRLDPETGDGIYNNPYYDTSNPRSPQSRTWGRGLRNPCRFSIKPGTGSHDIADADPGVFYIGDVGWGGREEMSVCDGPALNFGWPKYEGMTREPGYNNATYVPANHERPKLDWRNGTARGLINGNIVNVGSAQLPGPSFTGNCSIGGVWYTGTDFPEEYRNTYFHADYGGDWIRNFGFNSQDDPTISRSFKQSVDRPIFIATDPNQGGLYYLTVGGGNYVRKFTYSPGNLPPTAVATSSVVGGASPLIVQFTGSYSYDPDQDNLTYEWNFGDGSPISNSPNPIHTYTQGNGNTVQYTAKLTVRDPGGLEDEMTLNISINNTAPQILSTSVDNINTFSYTNPSNLSLSANVTDAESSNSQLSYSWVVSLFHNDHSHDEPPINNPTGNAQLSPIGCDGTTYWYRITLTVTDPGGLSTTYYKDIQPNCGGSSQNISFSPIGDKLTTDGSFSLNPSSSSGLPVVLFLVSGPASISGNTVTLTGQPGEVVIRAAQGGNGTYAPAEAIDRSFQVSYPNQGGGGCSYTLIQSDNFESSYGNWNDGGTDATRLNDATYANSGTYSIRLRDDNSTSVMSTNNLNVAAYSELKVDFSYIVNSFDNSNEDFWLQISTNGGSSYTTVEEWNLNDEFQNLQRKNESITIQGPFTNNTRLRFRCDASGDGDQVYIDDVVVNGCTAGSNSAPTAAFSATPQSGDAPLEVNFNASASSDPEGDPLTYVWDFGDGNTASGENVSHTYSNAGSYTAILYVNDGQLSDQATREINTTIPGGCTSPQNLALNQATEQSSTYGLGISSLAVDGNQTGSSPWSADLQHTQSEAQPWWQVDLGQLSDLDAISIYNRTDALQERLSNFYVFVSSAPISSSATLTQLLADGSVSNYHFPGTAGLVVNLSLGIQGRYMRVQLAGSGVLHVAEVEVSGCPAGNDPCNGASPVVITPAGPFAENAGVQTLNASPSGGTWGGAAASNGSFNPSVGPGTYTVSYTYTDGNGCTQSDTEDIQVTAVGGCSTPGNLALSKPTSQSSTYGNGVAGLAVDGATNGTSPWSADLQHTNNEAQPWWEVDLGAFSQIDQVNVYNRSDCCQDRLRDFYVLVSTSPFAAGASLNDLLNNSSISQTYFSGIAGLQESIPVNTTGRYVRIQLSGSGVLHMSEVEVMGCSGGSDPCQGAQPVSITPAGPFAEDAGIQTLSATPSGGTWGGAAASNGTFNPAIGPGSYTVTYTHTNGNGCTQTVSETITVIPAGSNCSSPTNIAVGQTAAQSSVYGFGVASLAVDGNTDGTGSPWGNATLMHTQSEAQPWWQVDLGQVSDIQEVILYNRTGCCQTRLSDFYVLVSTTPFSQGATLSSLLNDPNISNSFFSGSAGNSERITINTEGRYVRVQLSSTSPVILHLAEVEVWGCAGTGARLADFSEFPNTSSEIEASSLTVFPNPIDPQSGVNAQLTLGKLGKIQIKMYDLHGKLIYSEEQKVIEHKTLLSLPTTSLSSGLYVLEVSGANVHLTGKVLVE
ncbi:MAG: PKD domain-containing protein [Bacteroidota bacterium]